MSRTNHTVSGPGRRTPDERTALRIVPGPNAIEKNAVGDPFTRLHSHHSWSELEVRLLSRGGAVEYYVCPDPTDTARIERLLRQVFPDETSIEAEPLPSEDLLADPTAGMELYGRPVRRRDWQTGLRQIDEAHQFPLAAVVDTIADAEATVVCQAVLTPKPDWKFLADMRIEDLKQIRDTPGQRFMRFITSDFEYDRSYEDAPQSNQVRIDAIREADTIRSFSVNVRAIASGPDAEAALTELGNAFTPLEGEYYYLVPHVVTDDEKTASVADRIREGTCRLKPSLARRLGNRLPIVPTYSPEIVAGSQTAPTFCLLDGDALTTEGRRAMQATPDEQTGLAHPPADLLAQYDEGMPLGTPLDADDTPLEEQVSLPPSLQPLHVAWFGKTGSGKSTALCNAILENHVATDGADILVDPKGDGMPVEYLQAHYAKYGDLEDVYYLDCSEVLPAISFFDIRDQLDEGIDRTTAVEDVVDHYVEILVGIMGAERFEAAVRSPDIIRYLVKAMFDPVHGADAFAHSELQDAAQRMHELQDAPPVADDELQKMLNGVAANSTRSFDALMQGVANRIEKIPLDDRLGHLFNHVPDGDDPHFDLREIIDEDALVIVDTSGLRTASQRALTLVLLSNLWTALQRRAAASVEGDDLPLVNLYLEEAASVASSGLVSELLARSRSFGLSVTLAMQFPRQLEEVSPEAYAEVLNNVSTVVTGNVAVDRDLTRRLATEEMPPAEVENRLGALRRGQWIASLPSAFGVAEPRPFVLESAPIPPGHPDGPEPFIPADRNRFADALEDVGVRSREEYGLDIATQRQEAITDRPTTAVSDIDEDARMNSALPYTERMPEPVEYDESAHALVCSACENTFNPDVEGMRDAIECCHRPADVDRDDVPICELHLELSADERRQSAFSDAQLRFLVAVHRAHQRAFDPDLEYDLIEDSMVRLQEYVGASDDGVQALVDAGVLTVDCTHPHTLYTVTPDGRSEANIEHIQGIHYGDGVGDLGESSLHVVMVELGRRYIEQVFVDDPDSPVETARSYHDIDGYRLDAVGLDADGDVVVTVEAERSSNGSRGPVTHDFDKMAATDPEHAIWVVPNRDVCHEVMQALHDPSDGEQRIDTVYSRHTSPQTFKLDYEGMTEIHTLQFLRDSVLAE